MQNLEDDKKLLHCIFNTKYVFEILNSKYLPLQEINLKVLGLFKQILMDIFVHFFLFLNLFFLFIAKLIIFLSLFQRLQMW